MNNHNHNHNHISIQVPEHKLGIATIALQEAGKRPCFRIKGLRITIATPYSKNPGYLYIRNEDWDYIGKISPAGYLKIMHPSMISAEQKMLVLAAIVDPESIAMTDGIATGICCCCGRTLTNKLSIELGIGPICRGYWFPPEPQTQAQAQVPDLIGTLDIGPTPEEASANKLLEELENIATVTSKVLESLDEPLSSTLELDLGTPYSSRPNTKEEVKDAVELLAGIKVTEPTANDLVAIYRSLDTGQRKIFLELAEAIDMESEDNDYNHN